MQSVSRSFVLTEVVASFSDRFFSENDLRYFRDKSAWGRGYRNCNSSRFWTDNNFNRVQQNQHTINNYCCTGKSLYYTKLSTKLYMQFVYRSFALVAVAAVGLIPNSKHQTK